VRSRKLGYGAAKERVLRRRVTERRGRAERAAREISSLEMEMEMETETETETEAEAERHARIRALRREAIQAEVRTLGDKRRMRVRPTSDAVHLAATPSPTPTPAPTPAPAPTPTPTPAPAPSP
jgi:hypothetical protein